MTQELGSSKSLQNSKNNKNMVRVNNNINLTINLGDSLNLLALIAGIYLIRRVTKKRNEKM
jgi:hypothetical protein